MNKKPNAMKALFFIFLISLSSLSAYGSGDGAGEEDWNQLNWNQDDWQ